MTRIALQSALFVSTLLASFSPYAFASRETHDFDRVLLKQDQLKKVDVLRVQGELTCTQASATNDGESCVLRIREKSTGKTFQLLNARAVMQLYQSGTDNVAIEGTQAGEDAIEVSKVSSL